MDFTIDRALPVPIRRQLKGLIEYGVACGDLAPGEAMPSVRDLALQLGIAPMTVSQVYADLKGLGLIVTRAGSGTFVAETGQREPQPDLSSLHGRIDALIDEGVSLGLRTSDMASLIHARLAARMRLGSQPHVAMVGIYQNSTVRYARLIAGQIGRAATVEPATVDGIQRSQAVRARIGSADLVITFVNRQREVASLLPGTRVTSIRFVPSDETRHALAAVAPESRLLLVARDPEFLPIMKAGVARLAIHAGELRSTAGGPADVAALAATTDAVVYASGTEDSLSGLPPSLPTIEYTHVPDPADVQRRIAPLLKGAG
jgi:DNA-binding transcriptional regulator YhcF (GntR family)